MNTTDNDNVEHNDSEGMGKKSFLDKDAVEWDSEIAGGRSRSILPEHVEGPLPLLEPDTDELSDEELEEYLAEEPSYVEIRNESFEEQMDEIDSNPLLSPHLVENPPPDDFEDGGMAAGFVVPEEEFEEYRAEEEDGAPAENLSEGEFSWDFATFAPPGPTTEENKSLSVVGNLPADAEMIRTEVTEGSVKRLIQRTEVARQRVNQEIDSIPIAQNLLDIIRSGKTLLMSGKENFEEAERLFNEVEYRLAYNKRVKFWSGSFALRLLAYEIGWLFVLGLGAFLFPPMASAFVSGDNPLLPLNFPAFINPNDVYTLVSTMMWGGLGGVVGAMYSLWRHVSVKQDFNPQHSIWYFTQPLMGLPIGAFIFITLQIGIVLTYDATVNITNPLIIYSIAWIAGFQQNVLYEIVRQIIKLFRIERSENPVQAS